MNIMNEQAKVWNTKLSIIIPTLYQDNYYIEILKNLNELWYWEWDEWIEIITIANKLVNEAWNEWVSKSSWEYILIINDDIIIKEWCIEQMMRLLEYHTISCPYYSRKDDLATMFTWNWENICWFCFMFKRKSVHKLFPIPAELKLWYWDNWLYHRANKDIWRWWLIHHWESKTLYDKSRRERIQKILDWDSYIRHSFYKLICQ